MNRWLPLGQFGIALLVAAGGVEARESSDRVEQAVSPELTHVRPFIQAHCIDCHNAADPTAGLALDELLSQDLDPNAELWEKVVRKLATRQMPPPEMPRPEEQAYDAALSALTAGLDAAAAENPHPGRTGTFRRLNRTEYQNAIRDLLALEIDAGKLLPGDDASHGFDNVTVGDLSPTLLERYIAAAQVISRRAIGSPLSSPDGDTFRIPADRTQEEHVEGLPLGTRGGTSILYHFPQDGEYEIRVRLTRDRNEEVEGLTEPHDLEILLDRERAALFTVTPPRNAGEHATVDSKLKVRIPVAAGPHTLGVTFLKQPSALLETKRQPYAARFNMHRHPRTSPAVYQVSIIGPYEATGHGDTPSRRRIFVCTPTGENDELDCAKRILSALMRRAYRRPMIDADLRTPLKLYRQARADGGFEDGIELALSAILVSPNFLFRIEQDPPDVPAGSAYRLSDVELASRLSFFLWSSIPDDELLDLAVEGRLSEPGMIERQARRMLADPRSASLSSNFAGQWLQLRNLAATTPDLRRFPGFDDNLRQAMRRETELLFASIISEDRSVLDLLTPGYTFLNERLAGHYGIPHIYGSRFRRVPLGEDSVRGGLLRQGSILTVTSYATRTSPVIRGKWVLENLLGTPVPPPPPNIPALKEDTISSTLPVRERLMVHRADAACASCHDLIDPVGFSLEQFDAVGRWRTSEDGRPVDATGGLPDGSAFEGVTGLEQALLSRPELFVGTLTEKLLTFALGRGVEYYDAPAVRKIVREALAEDYRFSSIIVGIVTSTPFQMRSAE